MGTYKSISQIRRLGNLHRTETIVTEKFRGLRTEALRCGT